MVGAMLKIAPLHNLDRAIKEVVSWSQSWLPDASAAATLVKQYNDSFRTPESPERRREHKLFWEPIFNVVGKTRELARAVCGLLDQHDLVLLLWGSFQIESWINKPPAKMIQGFIPETLAMEEKEAKAILWNQYMVLRGLRHSQDPLAFLFPSHCIIWSGVYARQRFQQLEQKHPLTYSATLGWLSWPGNEEYLWNAGEKIAKSAEWMIPKSIRPQNVGKRDPLVCSSIEVLLKEFGKYPPEEILERALGGLFDHIPKAVFHDVIDNEKSDQDKFERGVMLASDLVRKSNDGEKEESLFEELPDPSGKSPEDYLVRDLAQEGSEESLAFHLEAFSKSYPYEGSLLKSLLEEKKYADIAHEEKKLSGRKKKLTKGRISQLMTKAVNEFAHWYSSRD